MNAPLPRDESYGSERDLRAALISTFKLSAEAVDHIYESMQPTDLSFSDAALRLGYVTPADLAAALDLSRGEHPHQPGLVENAIRKVSSSRSLVVRQGETVTPGSRLSLANDPYNVRNEKIRALRTELLLLNEGTHHANIVPVVSPSAQEGRSQLAAELAISFAQLGRRTLLVDGDMRRPQQHLMFDCVNDTGLSRAISTGERPCFRPVEGFPRMHLLTAGPVPPNPLELLSDGRFEKLFSEWRNAYEFIVIDTPPAAEFADALAIATMAGRVLLVSRAQHSSYQTTKSMLRRLETTQSKILGAILNHF